MKADASAIGTQHKIDALTTLLWRDAVIAGAPSDKFELGIALATFARERGHSLLNGTTWNGDKRSIDQQ